MGIFSRLFKIGQSEANALVDKLEDPIKMAEQGIRDLKVDLDNSLKALAEVKAMAIRAKNEKESNAAKATEYEQKAMLLVQNASQGKMDPTEADRLATVALQKRDEFAKLSAAAATNQQKFDANVAKLDTQIKQLRNNISTWENELKTLQARAKVSEATKNVNKHLAAIDSNSTISMLERMKEKVDKQEALAEAYGDIADENKSVDDEINKALTTNTQSDSLAALKAKMNLGLPPAS